MTPARRSAFLLATMTAGCAMGQAHPGMPGCPAPGGYAVMDQGGTLTLHFSQPRHGELVETHAPGSAHYGSYVVFAGSPRPGERKELPDYSAFASMDANGVITITTNGSNVNGLISEPTTGELGPDDPNYRATVARLGGLEPGEFRGIPASVPPECEHGAGH